MNIPLKYKDRRCEAQSTLRQTQLVLLHLLYVFDAICEKHGIRYWLAWGTCLGAMRHNGFIPWDDDLDVGLMAKDYQRLLKILPQELPNDVLLQRPEDNPGIAICFAKLRDAYSFCGEARYDTTLQDPSGLFIDIFPFDEVPDIGVVLSKFLIKACGSSWHRYHWFKHKMARRLRTALPYFLLAAILRLCNWLFVGLANALRLMFPSSNLSDSFNSGAARLYQKDWFMTVVRHEFEDGLFPVPVGAESYLTVRYGDWRQIPPSEKRPQHAKFIDPFHSADGVNFKG